MLQIIKIIWREFSAFQHESNHQSNHQVDRVTHDQLTEYDGIDNKMYSNK